MDDKLDIVEVDPFDGESGVARAFFDKFQEELNKCVYWLKGKDLNKRKVQNAISKKVRKVFARAYNIEFFEAGQVYVVRDGMNYVIKIRQDEEFITLLRIHVDELKD